MEQDTFKMPLIGDVAPSFKAVTTQGGIQFPEDYKGNWVVFFSHPSDFTPVCTTEFMTFAAMSDEFEALNTKLLGLSVDSVYSHIAWIRRIEEFEYKGMKNIKIKFPLIADLKTEISRKYGMLQPNQSETYTVRAVFIIDPNSVIRTILYYPMSTGRNFDEIKRVIMALQKTDEDHISTPANWQPGDDVIIPTATTYDAAKEVMNSAGNDQYHLDWFLNFKKEK